MPINNPGGAGGGIDLTLSGNSTSGGAGYALVSSGTLSLAGGNNITLSQDGNKITVSGANAGGAQTGISGIAGSNTTYTSGTVSFTGVGGGITVSSNTGQRIDLSVAAPVAQTVQTQNVHNLSVSSSVGGGTAGTMAEISSGTVTLYAGNNITLSQSATNKLVISGPNTFAQQTGISGIAASNTTYTSGTLTITGVGGGVTVSSNTGQRVDISVAAPVAQTAQTQSNIQAVVPLGNTTGTTGSIQTGTLGIAGGNNITISQSSGTASTNLTISAANQTVQTQNCVDLTLSGNSTSGGAGYALVSSGTLSLAGGPNITLSQDGNKISISGGAGAGGGVNIAVTNTTYTSGTVIFSAAGGAITVTSGAAQHVDISVPATTSLSASTNITLSVTGSTIQFSVADPYKIHQWQNMPEVDAALMTHVSGISKTPFYWPETIPGLMTINSIIFAMSNVATATLQSFSVHFGVYTFANSTSAALLGSGSDSFVVSTASSVSFSGNRHFVLTSPGTVAAISKLTPGNYLFGMMFSAAATGSMHQSLYGALQGAPSPLGVILPGANQLSTGTSQGAPSLMGRGSTTVNVMPANVVRSELVNQGTGASAVLHPWLYIRS